VEQAIHQSESQDPFDGQEVLYLFASHIRRLQGDRPTAQKYAQEALRLNPNYGRAYIAQAHIYYDEGKLYQAIEYFEKAKDLPNQPFGAYISEKADFGIGNSCWVQLQYVNQAPQPDHSASAELEDCVLNNYNQVIDSYKVQENPGANLSEITAWAYYGTGTVLQDRGQLQDAQRMYRQALDLTTDQDLIQLIDPRLREVEK
jgi:tetratricopeptide (TPR) repeat protein